MCGILMESFVLIPSSLPSQQGWVDSGGLLLLVFLYISLCLQYLKCIPPCLHHQGQRVGRLSIRSVKMGVYISISVLGGMLGLVGGSLCLKDFLLLFACILCDWLFVCFVEWEGREK